LVGYDGGIPPPSFLCAKRRQEKVSRSGVLLSSLPLLRTRLRQSPGSRDVTSLFFSEKWCAAYPFFFFPRDELLRVKHRPHPMSPFLSFLLIVNCWDVCANRNSCPFFFPLFSPYGGYNGNGGGKRSFFFFLSFFFLVRRRSPSPFFFRVGRGNDPWKYSLFSFFGSANALLDSSPSPMKMNGSISAVPPPPPSSFLGRGRRPGDRPRSLLFFL